MGRIYKTDGRPWPWTYTIDEVFLPRFFAAPQTLEPTLAYSTSFAVPAVTLGEWWGWDGGCVQCLYKSNTAGAVEDDITQLAWLEVSAISTDGAASCRLVLDLTTNDLFRPLSELYPTTWRPSTATFGNNYGGIYTTAAGSNGVTYPAINVEKLAAAYVNDAAMSPTLISGDFSGLKLIINGWKTEDGTDWDPDYRGYYNLDRHSLPTATPYKVLAEVLKARGALFRVSLSAPGEAKIVVLITHGIGSYAMEDTTPAASVGLRITGIAAPLLAAKTNIIKYGEGWTDAQLTWQQPAPLGADTADVATVGLNGRATSSQWWEDGKIKPLGGLVVIPRPEIRRAKGWGWRMRIIGGARTVTFEADALTSTSTRVIGYAVDGGLLYITSATYDAKKSRWTGRAVWQKNLKAQCVVPANARTATLTVAAHGGTVSTMGINVKNYVTAAGMGSLPYSTKSTLMGVTEVTVNAPNRLYSGTSLSVTSLRLKSVVKGIVYFTPIGGGSSPTATFAQQGLTDITLRPGGLPHGWGHMILNNRQIIGGGTEHYILVRMPYRRPGGTLGSLTLEYVKVHTTAAREQDEYKIENYSEWAGGGGASAPSFSELQDAWGEAISACPSLTAVATKYKGTIDTSGAYAYYLYKLPVGYHSVAVYISAQNSIYDTAAAKRANSADVYIQGEMAYKD